MDDEPDRKFGQYATIQSRSETGRSFAAVLKELSADLLFHFFSEPGHCFEEGDSKPPSLPGESVRKERRS